MGTMLASAIVSRSGFNAGEFERAFTAADFDRCRELVDAGGGFDAVLAGARLAIRERRYLEIIATLSDVPKGSAGDRIARDVLLGAAPGFTRDYTGGRRLIERALKEMKAGDEWYYDAIHYRGLIAWMKQEHREAAEAGEG